MLYLAALIPKIKLFNEMDGTAIILANGLLNTDYAKTSHGLIRGTERYEILAVIDPKSAGQDAGVVTDNVKRDIPVFESIASMKQVINRKIDYGIVGVATKGGVIPNELMVDIMDAIKNGYTIVNGLHQYLSDKQELVELSKAYNAELLDIRKPKPASMLKFWTGEITDIDTPIIAVLGTDCALGKRTTARFLRDSAREAGINSEMIYTGQTGWLQGGDYGFIFDSTLNDFVSGEMEHAIVSCHRELNPDLIILEGQAAMLNPSGPCGAEFIISGNARGVILQHSPNREYYSGWESLKLKIPPIDKNITVIESLGAQVLAITLNTKDIPYERARQYQKEYQDALQIPVALPVEEGVNSLVPVLKDYIKNNKVSKTY